MTKGVSMCVLDEMTKRVSMSYLERKQREITKGVIMCVLDEITKGVYVFRMKLPKGLG